MKMLCEYSLGDMLARYVTDEQEHVGLMLLPASRSGDVLDKEWAVESLVQCHARGISCPTATATDTPWPPPRRLPA